jgi:hypothetical protein
MQLNQQHVDSTDNTRLILPPFEYEQSRPTEYDVSKFFQLLRNTVVEDVTFHVYNRKILYAIQLWLNTTYLDYEDGMEIVVTNGTFRMYVDNVESVVQCLSHQQVKEFIAIVSSHHYIGQSYARCKDGRDVPFSEPIFGFGKHQRDTCTQLWNAEIVGNTIRCIEPEMSCYISMSFDIWQKYD